MQILLYAVNSEWHFMTKSKRTEVLGRIVTQIITSGNFFFWPTVLEVHKEDNLVSVSGQRKGGNPSLANMEVCFPYT